MGIGQMHRIISRTVGSLGYQLGLVIVSFLFFGLPLFSQDASKDPLTYEYVKSAVGVLADTRLRVLVNEAGVDFELTATMADELRKKGASQELLDLMLLRHRVPKAGVTVSCKPVDCDVFLNGMKLGTSAQGRFTLPEQSPGKITVEARAAGFQDSRADLQLAASQEISHEFVLEAIPAPPPPTPQPTPPPAPPPVPAPSPPAPAVAPAAPAVPVASDNPTDKPKVELDAAPRLNAQQVLNRVVEACGGAIALNGFAKYVGTGNVTVVSGRASLPQTEAQLTESVLYPGRIKWDLRIAGLKWTVTNSGEEIASGGDARFRGSELGQELERNIKMFISLQIPALISKLLNKGVRLSLKPSESETPVLVAQTSDDRYTISLDSGFRPVRVLHEALTGLAAATEAAYGRYEATGKVTLPFSMTLRYPTQPGYGHEIRYMKIDPAAPLKDSDFKMEGLFKRLIPGK